MSTHKRRADAPADKRPEKKQKSEKSQVKAAPAQSLSVLRDEETAFPRGGANVLTPLERRQIQIQAKQDVLFEQTTGKKAPVDFDSDTDTEEIGASGDRVQATSKVQKKVRKDKSGSKKVKTGKPPTSDDGPRIEGLSYKRLAPGSVALGQVASINRYDVTITLPNSLTGYLPLTAISEEVTSKVEAHASNEDDGNEDNLVEELEPDDLSLQNYLRVGQYLRVLVTDIGGDSAERAGRKDASKRHISLSAIPTKVNVGLTKADLIAGNVMQASIKSVEDHGVIMNVGLDDENVHGFMSTGDIPTNVTLSELKPGGVMLCLSLGMNASGNTVKLCAKSNRLANIKKDAYLKDAPSVDTFLPGCAVEILVTSVTEWGLTGKAMGLLDVTADWIHSGRDLEQKPLSKRHPVNSLVRARVICTFPTSSTKKLGVSLLPHVLSLSMQTPKNSQQTPTQSLSLSSIIEQAKIVNVQPSQGIILDVGVHGVLGYAHISRISDEKVRSISTDAGPYKVGTTHRARVIAYNSLDGQFIMSLQESTLSAAFLRIEDIRVGEVVQGTVSRTGVNASGGSFMLLELANDVVGYVSPVQLSDVKLQQPEKKFRHGSNVRARVLDVDREHKRIALTCKKTLVNSEAPVWKSYTDPQYGEQSPGTIINLTDSGAVVLYYGGVKAFLPASQMSESFVKDPRQLFHIGQVVTTHPISIDIDDEKMQVSCRDPSAFGPQQRQAFEDVEIGSLVSGTISEKSKDSLVVQLSESGLRGKLLVEHLTDGSIDECTDVARKLRVEQRLSKLIVLSKHSASHTLHLSYQRALRKATQEDKFPSRIEDISVGGDVVGFVASVTATGAFVRFGAGLTGLLPASAMTGNVSGDITFGLRVGGIIRAKVSHVEGSKDRFTLTQKELASDTQVASKQNVGSDPGGKALVNPVDENIKVASQLTQGTRTKARVVAVKDTQLNVVLADDVQGRIDVSQIFDTWEDIRDRKSPLAVFNVGQIIPVRVLGQRDHRNHRFLPISNTGKARVLELTAKPSDVLAEELKLLQLDDVDDGKDYLCFVNNISNNSVWVNITPNVRGRINAMDASENISLLSDLEANFPIGSAIRAHVLSVDAQKAHLNLSARSRGREPTEFSDLTEGNVLAAKVVKVSERLIVVSLSKTISGPVHLVELADDYDKADPTLYEKDQIVRVHVTKVDLPNKKLTLSTRPSKTLSSKLPVKDRNYQSAGQLKVNDIVRGFVKNVDDKLGIFVSLSTNLTALVPVRELSDEFMADWQSRHEVGDLVKGRVIQLDAEGSKIQLSLKASALAENYKAPLSWHDLKSGMIVTGKIRKVEDYGVFILVDNSSNVSGLCHKSEMAEERVKDVKALFSVGDRVKAKVLKVDLTKAKRELAFGLKASYFLNEADMSSEGEDEEDRMENESDASGGIVLPDSEDGTTPGGTGLSESSSNGLQLLQHDSEDESLSDGSVDSALVGRSNGLINTGLATSTGLNVGIFDWSGQRQQQDMADNESDDGSEAEQSNKRRKKPTIQVDRTAELDVNGPQSSDDFERLLMSDPNSSSLWVPYMAYYLDLNDVAKARETAERAINMVNHQRKDTEEDALNVWVAYVNLENTYGSKETLDAVFTRAKQYNDAQEIHNRLASIYIQSGKHEEANDLFQSMVKKFSQNPATWLNYATFLFDTVNQPVQARDLLPRAVQALPGNDLDTTIKFAQLEFKSPHGDIEQGRTRFEKLISAFPKRTDLLNVYLDLEIKVNDKDTVRRLFQRATNNNKLKPKQAKYFFKRWEDWEAKNGDAKGIERVRAKALDWVRKHEEERASK